MIFEIQKGCFGYGKDKNILQDISLRIKSGEVLAILGSNGIGKTTLLKCMVGFLKWRSGRSLLEGRDIEEISQKEIWKKIAYVPQARGSVFAFTGLDMTLIGRGAHLGTFTQPSDRDVEKALEVLKMVGAAHLRDRLCSQMSGGELQLVLLARALSAEPELLILDEPESGLDFKNQLVILELLRGLAKEQGISVILNTHYPIHALKISDKVLIINREHGYSFGKTREIISEESMRSAFEVNVFIGSIEVEQKRYDNVIPLSVI